MNRGFWYNALEFIEIADMSVMATQTSIKYWYPQMSGHFIAQ